jgi:uncharacterized phage-associated protein
MPHSADVAEHILRRLGPMPAMKLQKLVYYCQAWSLVWDERPMIDDEFQAWANGPVAPELYDRHRGQYVVSTVNGEPSKLDETALETIESVIRFYGDKHSQWLSELTHTEDPWREARGNLPPGARSNAVITHAAMHEYYSSL